MINQATSNTTDPVNVFVCRHIGVSKTTKTFFQTDNDGVIHARCGIAIMGYSHMLDAELKHANPFDAYFADNYAEGTGTTKDVAIANLDQDLNRIAGGLYD